MAQLDITAGQGRKEGESSTFQDSLASLVPHPVATAFLLTVLFLVVVMAGTGKGFEEVLKAWGQGFIGLYPFVMENLLILLLGFALGSTPIIKSTIGRLAGALNSTGPAVAVIAGVSILLAFFNWGVGILGGVFLAQETCRRARARGLKLDYPLLLAAGLSGATIWETGFSGVVPLYLAEGKHFLLKTTANPIGIGSTILSPLNLGVAIALLVAVPLALYLMRPAVPSSHEPPAAAEPPARTGDGEKSVAAYLERSWILSLFFGGLALLYVIRFFAASKALDLPNLLFALLALGIFLHKRPLDYQKNVISGVRAIWFIALPLMFYSAIYGTLTATGFADMVGGWLSAASAAGLPVVTLVVATVTSLLAPSAGGQLMLGGPSVMIAAKAVGVSYGKVALALAYGAGLAKLLQLSLFAAAIGLTKGEARMASLVKYTAVVFGVAFVICLIGLIVLPA